MTLKKNGQCPQTHYISFIMMYLCKFGHDISTRCSDEMQISFFLMWEGYFGIVWVGGKFLSYEPASVPIFQTYTALFERIKRYIENNIPIVIWL